MNKKTLYERIMTSISKEIKKSLNSITYRDQRTYENALIVEIEHNYLNETYHVVNTFNDCIQDIIKNISKFKLNIFNYTNWNYDYTNNKCVKSDITTNILPIYVKLIDDNEYINVMSVENRKDYDKISITINLLKLNTFINNKAILAHEFRHVLEMYVDKNKSHINDNIDKLPNDMINVNSAYFNDAINIVNIFAKSEERARMDGAIHYLKDLKPNLSTIKNSHEQIAKLVDLSKDHHLLYRMNLHLEELHKRNKIGLYDISILVGYLWNKYTNDKINVDISEKDVLDANNEHIANVVYDYLENNYNEFYSRLIDVIATHIIIK